MKKARVILTSLLMAVFFILTAYIGWTVFDHLSFVPRSILVWVAPIAALLLLGLTGFCALITYADINAVNLEHSSQIGSRQHRQVLDDDFIFVLMAWAGTGGFVGLSIRLLTQR